MFFTITSVEHVLLDLDEFLPDGQVLFNSIKQALANYKVIGVTAHLNNRWAVLDTAGMEVITASNFTEARVFQNVLRKALTHIGGVPSNSVYIAAGGRHLRNACELLLGTVIVKKPGMSDSELIEIFQSFPDFLVHDAEWMLLALTGKHVGYGAEYLSAPTECRIFPTQKPLVSYTQVPNEEHPDCPMVIAGRYFGGNDPRHDLHPLSIRLVGAKNKPELQAELFGPSLGIGINWAVAKEGVDLIGCVPPRPGEPNRMASFLDAIPSMGQEHLRAPLRPELLKCVVSYPKLKTLAARTRRDAVRGAFTLTESVNGKTVVVIDDIRTTGSTLNEAITVLKAGGAARIIPVVIGYHPFASTTLALSDDEELHCTYCQHTLKPKLNGKTGQPFYGCSGWSPTNTTHTSQKLGASIRAKLQRMEAKLMRLDDELNSEGIEF